MIADGNTKDSGSDAYDPPTEITKHWTRVTQLEIDSPEYEILLGEVVDLLYAHYHVPVGRYLKGLRQCNLLKYYASEHEMVKSYLFYFLFEGVLEAEEVSVTTALAHLSKSQEVIFMRAAVRKAMERLITLRRSGSISMWETMITYAGRFADRHGDSKSSEKNVNASENMSILDQPPIHTSSQIAEDFAEKLTLPDNVLHSIKEIFGKVLLLNLLARYHEQLLNDRHQLRSAAKICLIILFNKHASRMNADQLLDILCNHVEPPLKEEEAIKIKFALKQYPDLATIDQIFGDSNIKLISKQFLAELLGLAYPDGIDKLYYEILEDSDHFILSKGEEHENLKNSLRKHLDI